MVFAVQRVIPGKEKVFFRDIDFLTTTTQTTMRYKKNFVLIPALLVMAFILNSCGDDIFGVSGSGSVISEQRNISGFDKVELDIAGNVEITRDSVFNIEVSDYENLVPHIATSVKGGTLTIRHDPRSLTVRHSMATIKISMPDVSEINLSGSGIISLNSEFRDLNSINISGSGEVKALEGFETSSITVRISGSGNAILSGTAGQLNTNISGSGNINAYDLESQNANCVISGSGNSFVNVIRNLKATISGSGNITYMGSPKISVNVSGSGKIIAR